MLQPNTAAASMWLNQFSDGLQATTILWQGASAMQKSQYDNLEIMQKTESGILNKRNNYVLALANQQDKLFKEWEKYVAGG